MFHVRLGCSVVSIAGNAVWKCEHVTNVTVHCAEAITQGVPVSVLDDEYGRATIALAQKIQEYADLDLYSPDRAKVAHHPESALRHEPWWPGPAVVSPSPGGC